MEVIYREAFEIAVLLLGENDPTLQTLCAAVVDSYLAALRPGLSQDAYAPSLAVAAGMVTVSLMRQSNPMERFSAATLSVDFRESSDSLVALAEKLIAPFVAKSGLAFRSVIA